MKTTEILGLMFVFFVFALMFIGLNAWDIEDLQAEKRIEDKHYCEMVELHRYSTDKYLGHPDYKHIYDKICTN